ncbi:MULTISPECIES: hypothetical protein [Prochlorococcus]|uniref:Uncharacterized protein n=1 Tax=Prochlorococcus marinus str. MIT 9116 TaxID=167544 RepID=A0A0A1ZS86_PROMR|nr:hypothetical protein [Prochlorococcus marinus]KGF89851.1 hypothetical protein EU92_1642 [Prochlorococcus marinus str. MIT 9107]KGF92300.1 hypothetical protein EU93_0564 [Prochlorococcus marinus str. MIT 9116]KGF92617.1 hypothetical protein EU94_1615 [Prochlorococcus marinus str. MIT 9123]
MFETNQAKQPIEGLKNNTKIIDPLTIWLIRIACLLIIIVFSGLLLGVPFAISLSRSLLNDTLLNAKEVLRNLIETSLT